jgi:septal ring factor EnvC (AmiA/AmiB activator)
MTEGNNPIWKQTTLFLAGVVLTGAAAWATINHSAVTRDEVPQLIAAYSQSPQLQLQLTQQSKQIDEQSTKIGQLQAQVGQLQLDVARISEHLGVTARPGKP